MRALSCFCRSHEQNLLLCRAEKLEFAQLQQQKRRELTPNKAQKQKSIFAQSIYASRLLRVQLCFLLMSSKARLCAMFVYRRAKVAASSVAHFAARKSINRKQSQSRLRQSVTSRSVRAPSALCSRDAKQTATIRLRNYPQLFAMSSLVARNSCNLRFAKEFDANSAKLTLLRARLFVGTSMRIFKCVQRIALGRRAQKNRSVRSLATLPENANFAESETVVVVGGNSRRDLRRFRCS